MSFERRFRAFSDEFALRARLSQKGSFLRKFWTLAPRLDTACTIGSVRIARRIALSSSRVRGMSSSKLLALVVTLVQGCLFETVCTACCTDAATGIEISRDECADTLHRLEPLALHGRASTQYWVGYLYALGGIDCESNFDKAKKWFSLAAQQNDTASECSLGHLYAHPPEGNDAEAAKWFRIAATNKSAEAQYYLGILYDLGEGVPRDRLEAIKWFRSAAEQGHAAAQSALGEAYSSGRSVDQNIDEAIRWFQLAAAQREPDAELALASLYTRMNTLPNNNEEAYYWYTRVITNPDWQPGPPKITLEARDKLTKIMPPDQVARAVARFDAWQPPEWKDWVLGGLVCTR